MSIYDPAMWNAKTPANVLGGRNRAIKALRDKQGRFLPNDPFIQSLWSLDPQHGRRGGLALLAKYGRGYFKALAQKRSIKCLSESAT